MKTKEDYEREFAQLQNSHNEFTQRLRQIETRLIEISGVLKHLAELSKEEVKSE